MVAVRCPNNNFLKKLILKTEQPIVSTSLNINGQEPLNNLDEIELYFKHQLPDLAVDTGKSRRKKPSKIIDITDMANIRVIRRQ